MPWHRICACIQLCGELHRAVLAAASARGEEERCLALDPLDTLSHLRCLSFLRSVPREAQQATSKKQASFQSTEDQLSEPERPGPEQC